MKNMKTILITLLVLVAAPARALDEWTKADTAWEAVAEVAVAADWLETASMAKRFGGRRDFELNPLLGRRPSLDRVNAFGVGSLVLHPVISLLLPSRYRRVWQAVTIMVEVPVAARNSQVRGVTLGFPF